MYIESYGKNWELSCECVVDKHALLWLINNHEIINGDIGELTKLRKFFLSLNEKEIHKTTYRSTNAEYLRKYPEETSITTLSRKQRHTIARDLHVDLDIKNCHPTLLLAFCSSSNINCPRLEEYVQNRDSILSLAQGMKTEVIRIINGGKPEILNDFVIDFYNEIGDVARSFDNGITSLNHYLIEQEDRALFAMVQWLSSQDISITSLAYDGLTIAKDDFYEEMLQALSDAIYESIGARVQIVQKPMNEGYELPEDYKSAPLVLPPRFKPQILKSATHKFDGRLAQDEYEAIVGEYDIIIDSRSTGMGKTTNAMNFLSKLESYIIPHHRMSLDEDYLVKFKDVSSYKDCKGKKCSIVINSLDKTLKSHFNGDYRQIEGIYIDEIRSVLRQTEMRDIENDVLRLLDILQFYEGPLILGDANITDEDVAYIQTLRPSAKIAILADKSRYPEFEISVYNGGITDTFVPYLMNHDFDRARLIVPYSCGITAMDGCLEMLKDIRGVSYININRETRKEIDMSAENLDKYDIIAFSPTISEGVSLDSPIFEKREGVCMFNTKSALPESCSQMVRRFRAVKQYTAFIEGDERACRFKTVKEYKKFAELNISCLSGTVSRRRVIQNGTSSFRIFEDECFTLHSKNAVENERQKSNWRATFMQKLTNNKFKVRDGTEADVYIGNDDEAKIARYYISDAKKARYVEIEEAEEITRGSYEILKSTFTKRKEVLQMERFFMKDYLLLDEVNAGILQYFDKPTRKKQILALRQIIDMNNGNRIPTSEIIKVASDRVFDNLSQATDFVYQRPYLKISAVVLNETHKLTMVLGWQELADLEPVENLNLSALREYLDLKKFNFLMMLKWRKPWAKKHHKELIDLKDEKFIDNIQRLFFDDIGITLARYDGTWHQICALENIQLGIGNPLYAKLHHYIVDEKDEHESKFFSPLQRNPCPYCDGWYHNYTRFQDSWPLAPHECFGVGKKEPKNYKCDKCPKEFGNRKTDWERHQKSCGVKKPKKEYKCEDCLKSFERKSNLDRHVKNGVCKK